VGEIDSRDELTMGAAGLSLCYSISIVLALKELLNKICELENNSVALERILEYCNLEEEAPWEQSTDLWDKQIGICGRTGKFY